MRNTVAKRLRKASFNAVQKMYDAANQNMRIAKVRIQFTKDVHRTYRRAKKDYTRHLITV